MGKSLGRGQILFRAVSALAIFIGGVMVMNSAEAQQTQANAHQFTFETLAGEPMPLVDYKGKVLLIVNTASQCGFTKQYTGLEQLYQKYKDQGLVVIGVPCNQFGGQEPGTAEKIKAFTQEKYGITFPMTAKYEVNGDNAHPFFAWIAKEARQFLVFSNAPKWNFHKYLIGKDGEYITNFGSPVEPMSEKMTRSIEAALKA